MVLGRKIFLSLLIAGVVIVLFLHGWLGWDVSRIQQSAIDSWLGFARGVRWVYDQINDGARVLAPIVTILGGGYAIFHKWNYNRRRMHIHIDDFIARENTRLKSTRVALGKTVERPSPGRQFADGIFVKKRLQPKLKQMNWDHFRWGRNHWSPLNRADENIEVELGELDDQIKTWGNVQEHYNERIAQGHLLRGAIAAARAAREKTAKRDAWQDNLRAFEHFQKAHMLNQSDPEALEYMGHMRVRLGQYPQAIEDFVALEELAPQEGKSLLRARALKFQAEVNECREQPSFARANVLLNSAIAALPDEEAPIEGSQLYEFQGRVRKKMLPPQIFLPAAVTSYTTAAGLYQRTIDENISEGEGRNIERAKAGLQRCRDALAEIAVLQAEILDDGNSSGTALAAEQDARP